MSFNNEIADRISKSISRMDPDEAEMFARFFVYEVHKTDIENNRRTLDRHIIDVSKRLSLAVEEISKWKPATPYELEYGRPQPRNSGRWAKTSGGTPKKRKFEISYERSRGGGDGYNLNVNDFDVTNALSNTNREASKFQEAWTRSDGTDPGTNDRLYRRIAAGGKLLQALPSDQAKLAGSVGVFAGNMGPEAEKVIGPAARRTAYRYRGTERMADDRLDKLHERELREMLYVQGADPDAPITPEIRMAAGEKAAIRYFIGKDSRTGKNRLPSKGLDDLQRASGKIPPSEGLIINADGDIVTQAVGYNEDHYLPFNLKNLKGLQGGSYVRTRASGGLTTEDIYTGLVAGARSVTVVSRSGVFTLDFNDDLRGGRRYSDKARQMVGQYGQILDAVQSEQVPRRKLKPAERAAIREEVTRELGGYGIKLTALEDAIRQREREYSTSGFITKEEEQEVAAKAKELADNWQSVRGGLAVGRKDPARVLQHDTDDAPRDPKARYDFYYSLLMDDVLAEKSSRMYQLDGEGYGTALQALQEQFPYYIQRVQFTPNSKEAPNKEKDKGYVRPKYNRPKEVKAGYYDAEIEYGKEGAVGRKSGKYSAADTKYQNYKRKVAAGTEEAAEVEEPKTEAERQVQARTQAAGRQQRYQAREALVTAIQPKLTEVSALIAQTPVFKEDPKIATVIAAAEQGEAFFDSLKTDSAKLEALVSEMKYVETELLKRVEGNDQGTQDFRSAVRTINRTIDRRMNELRNEKPFDRNEWSIDTPVPTVPYRFKGQAHLPGQPAETYTQGWQSVVRGAQLTELPGNIKTPTPDMTDEQLRTEMNKAQQVGSKLKKLKEMSAKGVASPELTRVEEDLYASLNLAGMDDGIVNAVKQTPTVADSLIDKLSRTALGFAELRSIRVASSGPETSSTPAPGGSLNINNSSGNSGGGGNSAATWRGSREQNYLHDNVQDLAVWYNEQRQDSKTAATLVELAADIYAGKLERAGGLIQSLPAEAQTAVATMIDEVAKTQEAAAVGTR